MSSELHNNIDQLRIVGPVAIGANGTVAGKVIDRQGFGGVEFITSYGAIVTTGTVVTTVVKEGDVTGTMTSVADADLLGTEALASRLGGAATSGVGANVSKRIGYKGNKRYVTVDMVKSGATSVGCMAVSAVLFNPHIAPQANP
ncbi:MAG TPA: hypothetical protein DCZ11_00270 [Gammaproteobacteria bacterium]|nr:hypothetical protein [Gammaproteobacteria bacterium]MCH76861.1 hypothetical protein [Gammaproteobacteria bacterium]